MVNGINSIISPGRESEHPGTVGSIRFRALGLAERMSEQPDLPQDTVREVAVLLAYLQRTVAGDPAASRRARQILADTGDDLSEVSAVAELLVALEGVEDLDRIIDAADHEAREQWPSSLLEAAALAGLLRRNRPDDPRAAEWATRVTDGLAARDRRNGNRALSRYVTARFLASREPVGQG